MHKPSDLIEITRNLFDQTCQYISEYLDLVQCSLCFRCAREQNIAPTGHHNCGRLNTHLLSAKCDEAQIDRWAEDVEHGLFHGLCVAMMGGLFFHNEFSKIKKLSSFGTDLLYIKEKNLKNRSLAHQIEDYFDPATYSDYHSKFCTDEIFSFERFLASALMHDFLKCNDHNQDSHDADLRRIFPDLMEGTYTHADPPNPTHPLAIGDVLELRRYPDWKDWYKPRVAETLLGKKMGMVACFYHCIRPALEFVFQHRDSLWIRHGAEIPQDILKEAYPQHPVDWLAVEMDRAPFVGCIQHDSVAQGAPWCYMSGLMPFEQFKKLNGEARPHMETYRDHLYVKVDAQWKDWVFVIGHCEPNQKWPYTLAEEAIVQGHRIVPLDLLTRFITLSNNLLDRVRIMNWRIDTANPR